MLLRKMALTLLPGAPSRDAAGRWLRSRRAGRVLGFGLVLALGGVAAVAGAQPAVPPAAAPAVNAQVGFERRVDLSPQQEEAEAEVLLAQMQATAATTQRMLAQARLARDVVKTLCLNDKLSQVDVASRSAADRKASLHAAVARNDRELSNHEFTILTVLKKRSEQLAAEANQCIGEEAAFIGATNVVTTVDTTLPTGDQTDMPTTSTAPPEAPPVSASATGT
jgi:hypothetical protein